MRDAERTCLRLARIVLEARTPLSITTGLGGRLLDTDLARDAWGLPAIPATGLKGVLRSLWQSIHREPGDAVFGFQDESGGSPARIGLSWGVVHDSHDRPARITAPRTEADLKLDPLLEDLRRLAQVDPLVRQRVAINERGVADAGKRAQFDRSVVPRGARFSVELSFWSALDAADEALFHQVLALFHDPLLRVGGATRAGLGRLEPVGPIRVARFDLTDPAQAATYRRIQPALARFENLEAEEAAGHPPPMFLPLDPPLLPAREVETILLRLEAQDLWRFGGGELGLHGDDTADPGARVLTESSVRWRNGRGSLGQRQIVVPASAIKGALRHRTLFHAYRLKNRFSACPGVEGAVAELFGSVRRGRDADTLAGSRGRVVIDDVFLDDVHAHALTHNAIDRFTGGVRQGLLFTEEMAGPTDLDLLIRITPTEVEGDPSVRRAFDLALDDLKRGWLPLGAAARAGHGVFKERGAAC